MGCGKSSVGREIALLGGRFLLDTDVLIEQHMGKNINEIFASVGESGFRRLESQLIAWLAANVKNAVIATGGGMPIYNDVKMLGCVFWLDISFELILERLHAEERAKRPLFSDISKARTLYYERKSYYKQCARYVLSSPASPSHIAHKIVACMEEGL